MALRIEKGTLALLIVLGAAIPAAHGQESLSYEVWRGRSRVFSMPPHIKRAGNMGTLILSEAGISFEEKTSKGARVWRWKYGDIQQLTIFPKRLKALTYEDNAWRLGADREFEFEIRSERTFEDAYAFLKGRLDQRLVAGVSETPPAALWELPVKHLTRFGGDEGTLQVGESEIVYRTEARGASRAWRYEDIDNISSSGPFQLTITTYERARLQYGSRKGFNFQLKEQLSQERYDDLWLRLNRSRGMDVLTMYREGTAAPRQ